MNAKITFVELVDLIAESTSTTKRVCELFLRELFSTVSQALIDGEDVKIKGVGTFKVIQAKPRKSVSVSTGNAIEISGHNKLSFTPDKSLADAVNQPFAQFETVFLDDAMTDERLEAIDKEYPSLFDQDLSALQKVKPTGDESLKKSEEDQPAVEETPAEDVKKVEEEIPVPEEQPVAEAVPVEKEDSSEPEKTVEPAHAAPVSRPMLIGIPIDGPSQPVPEPEPVEEPDPDEYFYRPAPRNAYTPTAEQLESMPHKHGKRMWVLVAIGVLVGCLLMWLLMRSCGKAEHSSGNVIAADSDTVALADEEPIVTETITDQNVLSTMAAKHYGSQWFWVYIYEENKDKISNPDNVPLGTVLVIPPAEKYGIDANDPASLKKAQNLSWKILKGKN